MITQRYISTLKDKLYKVLCLFEENNLGLTIYIDTLIYEVYGLYYLVEEPDEAKITSLICILEHFYDDSLQPVPDLTEIRREVFHSMSLVEKIKVIENGTL